MTDPEIVKLLRAKIQAQSQLIVDQDRRIEELKATASELLAACERHIEIQEAGCISSYEWREFGIQIRTAVARAKPPS